ncbi:MAG: helix-hairpin-helix domain-containing protein [Planctomycetes bacterium]|nr:helix-hairpin-helix domain-containing protein [Planctomycetota bacterium]
MNFAHHALVPALAGLLFGAAVLRPAVPDPSPRVPAGFGEPLELDPDRMCLRDLRRLPAIGPSRARAIVEARHSHGLAGGPESWVAIPGIGPETVRSAREFLEAAQAARAYTPRGFSP